MKKVLNWLLIAEVVFVFFPITMLLLAGYVWAIFVVIGMISTLTVPVEYFIGLTIIFLGTYGLAGVVKLLLLKVNPDTSFKINAGIGFCIVSGCGACFGMLMLIKATTIVDSLPFLLPILVSIQLLWINRKRIKP